jgi:hypothetical protein
MGWLGTILIAVVGDIILIGAAALTATVIRFQSLWNAITDDLLLVIVPAAVALNCYRLNTLRNSFKSVGRTLLALAIAAGLTFTMAFAFKVGATYSRVVTGVMLVTAAAWSPELFGQGAGLAPPERKWKG